MSRVALSIGSNLGDREAHIEAMERGLRSVLVDMRVSRLMETEPVGVDGPQPPYLNRVVVGYYSGDARRLLADCRVIESRLGRTRESPKCPRTADVDILLFGNMRISEGAPPDTLVVPHPELLNRRFCLEGLMSVDPRITVPLPDAVLTVSELYENMSAETAAQNVSFVEKGHANMGKDLKLPPHISYLCVEGVIGVGKTSLCRLLGRQLGARLVLEEIDDNPFLPKFYADRRAYALQTQLWFLLSRHRQLSDVAQQDLFHSVTVSDYTFAKDRIFAGMNLDDDELALYDSVAGALKSSVPRPDLVVYLQASTDTLLKRIWKRGRSFEFDIDAAYIDGLNEAYNNFFFHYGASPLLVINTNELDFIDDDRDFREVIEQIVSAKAGVNYYNPLSQKDKMLIYEQGVRE